MDNEKELQQAYFEYQYLQRQAQELQAQVTQVRELVAEADGAIDALNNLESEGVFQIGSGVMVKAKPSDAKAMVEIGARVVVEKTFPEAADYVKQKKAKLEKALENLNSKLEEIAGVLQEKEAVLRKAQEKGG